MKPQTCFLTGASGYLGRALSTALLARGHRVRALVRPGSEARVIPGCEPVRGNALEAESFAAAVSPADHFIQLVGVAHPGPAKAREFRSIDRVAGLAGLEAARRAGVPHFIYVSVAQPAPVMKAYQAVRREVEEAIRASGAHATVLRPWYILGPGHRWPWVLVPIYRLCEWLPATREGARRLGLVTLPRMVAALVHAVEHPARGFEVVAVPEIRLRGGGMETPGRG